MNVNNTGGRSSLRAVLYWGSLVLVSLFQVRSFMTNLFSVFTFIVYRFFHIGH
jgi:hypothetical protein